MLGKNAMRCGRNAGVLISSDIESDRTQHRDLVQCCHCQFTTIWTPGSGRYWGWCTRCNGFFCGWKESCHNCVPAELMIENLELGLPYHLAIQHRPVRVSLAGLLLPGD